MMRSLACCEKNRGDCVRSSTIRVVVRWSTEHAFGGTPAVSDSLVPTDVEPRPITQDTSSLIKCEHIQGEVVNELTAQKVFVIASMGRACFELMDHSRGAHQRERTG